jgi:hypothetical protein
MPRYQVFVVKIGITIFIFVSDGRDKENYEIFNFLISEHDNNIIMNVNKHVETIYQYCVIFLRYEYQRCFNIELFDANTKSSIMQHHITIIVASFDVVKVSLLPHSVAEKLFNVIIFIISLIEIDKGESHIVTMST